MEKYDIYQDIAARTGGDIYIGVVGPVRTGKSTFIKRFMDVLVFPNMVEVVGGYCPLKDIEKSWQISLLAENREIEKY